MSETKATLIQLEAHFGRGDYALVIGQLAGNSAPSVRELALLGIALLRTGQFNACEIPLATALARGDTEANVEFGNLLRATNQHRRATLHFKKILPELTGELKFRALRWYGVTLYSLGEEGSLEAIEEARRGYLGIGDHTTVARIAHTLAALHYSLGDFRHAKQLLDTAIPVLEQDTNCRPLLTAYNTLIDLYLDCGSSEQARLTLDLAIQTADKLNDPYTKLQLDARRILLMLKLGDYGGFIGRLSDLRQRADELGEANVYAFASNNLANHLSRVGKHADALRVLAELTAKNRDLSHETMMVAAMLKLRRGDAASALGELLKVRERAEHLNAHFDATKAILLAALCAYQMNDLPTSLAYLTQALSEIAGWPAGQAQASLEQELRDMEELLAHAKMTPALLPVITAALEDAAYLASTQSDDLFADSTLLEINVLGPQPKVLLGGSPCELRLPYSVAVLAYLALTPGHSRHEITADLWGDHDPTKAAYSFRQCLMEIRKACGPELVVMSGPHQEPRYSLSDKVSVHLDAQRVLQLVARNDIPTAVSAYRGVFLAKLPETDWIAGHRDELTMSLTTALRANLREAELSGDDRRILIIASAILSIDPEDLEMEELRIEKAQRVASPVELARYQAERKRRLN